VTTDDAFGLTAPDPAGPSQNVKYRQGVVRVFNPITLANTVDVGGTVFVNLPLLGVAEAASLDTGSVVGLLMLQSDRGGITYVILGRLVTPATAAAQQAITLLGSYNHVAVVAALESSSSSSLTDLTTVGPVISDVLIGASGKAEVSVSAYIAISAVTVAPASAHMAFTIAGATVRAATIPDSLSIDGALNNGLNATRSFLVEGLTPGRHVFRAVYAVTGGTAGFAGRTLKVNAL
jgi:hypothetical protein